MPPFPPAVCAYVRESEWLCVPVPVRVLACMCVSLDSAHCFAGGLYIRSAQAAK